MPIRASSNRAASNSARPTVVSLIPDHRSTPRLDVRRDDHRIQCGGWVHHEQPVSRAGGQEHPVAGGQPAPVPDGRRQMKMAFTADDEDALSVQPDDDDSGALADVQVCAPAPSRGPG
ncbi:hypothetical protein TPA0908_32800 [Micromonospora sp. AKA38]|nr:hypothetical protein TPA0908_32800 [Micromonospora sp. AKA38]